MTSSDGKPTKCDEKQKRLGEALRDNLRRRKDQSRGRKRNTVQEEQNKAKNQD